VLSSCYAPQSVQQEPLSVEIKTDRPIYQIGDKIILTARANRNCYLTLYDISTLGEVSQIFPNRYAQDSFITAGHVYSIPTKSDEFDFFVNGPPGMERVRAIVTMQDVNFFESGKEYKDEVFPRIYQAPGQFENSLNQKLNTLPNDQWAEASVTIQVR
jgi:hypothetical protein